MGTGPIILVAAVATVVPTVLVLLASDVRPCPGKLRRIAGRARVGPTPLRGRAGGRICLALAPFPACCRSAYTAVEDVTG